MAEVTKTAEIVERLRQQAQEIADEGHNGWGNTMQAAADHIETLARERDRAVEALRDFVAWMDSDDAGPDYGSQTRDTHPDGERIWREWWNAQNRLCARATESARRTLANIDTESEGER